MDTTISLPKELLAALAEMAQRTGRPPEELVREALTTYLVREDRTRPTVLGMFATSSISSDRLEEWLDDHWAID